MGHFVYMWEFVTLNVDLNSLEVLFLTTKHKHQNIVANDSALTV